MNDYKIEINNYRFVNIIEIFFNTYRIMLIVYLHVERYFWFLMLHQHGSGKDGYVKWPLDIISLLFMSRLLTVSVKLSVKDIIGNRKT